jgi:superfamily II DNA or RNA helicase
METNEQSVIPEKKVWILNAGQQEAHDWLLDKFILANNPEYQKVLLEGWAGTGKTFTINRVIESARKADPHIKFGMTAPTHKAVRQLKKMSELKDQLDFGTIHRFLVLKEVLKQDPKDSRKMYTTFEPDWNSEREKPIDNIDVLILDEVSMLNNPMYEYIEDYLRSRRDLKVIFMGRENCPCKTPLIAGNSRRYTGYNATRKSNRECLKTVYYETISSKAA